MIIMRHSETPSKQIIEEVEHWGTNLNNLMIVLVDLDDVPNNKPNSPHSHPHE